MNKYLNIPELNLSGVQRRTRSPETYLLACKLRVSLSKG
jgi:hypothetical protein